MVQAINSDEELERFRSVALAEMSINKLPYFSGSVYDNVLATYVSALFLARRSL